MIKETIQPAPKKPSTPDQSEEKTKPTQTGEYESRLSAAKKGWFKPPSPNLPPYAAS